MRAVAQQFLRLPKQSSDPKCLPRALSGQNPNRLISSSSKSCGNDSFGICPFIIYGQMKLCKFVILKSASAFGHRTNGHIALLNSGKSALVSCAHQLSCPARPEVPCHHQQGHLLMLPRAKYSKCNYCGTFPKVEFHADLPPIQG